MSRIDEHARWLDHDLSAKRYVYVWADGIYIQARLEDDEQCLLVLIGATAEGKRNWLGLPIFDNSSVPSQGRG